MQLQVRNGVNLRFRSVRHFCSLYQILVCKTSLFCHDVEFLVRHFCVQLVFVQYNWYAMVIKNTRFHRLQTICPSNVSVLIDRSNRQHSIRIAISKMFNLIGFVVLILFLKPLEGTYIYQIISIAPIFPQFHHYFMIFQVAT